jgi:hypothetical protein
LTAHSPLRHRESNVCLKSHEIIHTFHQCRDRIGGYCKTLTKSLFKSRGDNKRISSSPLAFTTQNTSTLSLCLTTYSSSIESPGRKLLFSTSFLFSHGKEIALVTVMFRPSPLSLSPHIFTLLLFVHGKSHCL